MTAGRGAAGALLVSGLVGAAACISGRVLSGYPGYPFATFAVPLAADSAFFALQAALADEGFPVDYSERENGLINTRVGPEPDIPIFLNVVIGEDDRRAGWTQVWVAGYEQTPTGPRRVNPLDARLWTEVMALSGRLSERSGGTAPQGPDAAVRSEGGGA